VVTSRVAGEATADTLDFGLRALDHLHWNARGMVEVGRRGLDSKQCDEGDNRYHLRNVIQRARSVNI